VLDRAAAIPGVISASISTGMPPRGTSFGRAFEIVGRPQDPAEPIGGGVNMVTPRFYDTLGIRILQGRAFTERDRAGGVPVAIVNEAFVKAYLPDVDPLTQRVRMQPFVYGVSPPGLESVEWQIVGVYGEVKNAGPINRSFPEIDLPFWQVPWPRTTMVVHTIGDPRGVQRSLGDIIHSLEPDLPLANVATMEQVVREAMAADRFHAVLFGAFAAVALILAAVGIYGVMSFIVAQRTQEIGVRMALGAPRARVLRDVLREGMATALAGAVVGAAGAWFVGEAMKGIIHGVDGFNPMAFMIVAAALLGTALVACWVPARRAASVDPIVALRQS
jgi:putative ABC transport system permease protein